jgi:pyruvate, water dikinase
MIDQTSAVDKMLLALKERAKELSCLYSIEELLKDPDRPLEDIFEGVIKAIPPGWRYPDACTARIVHEGATYTTPGFVETGWAQFADIVVGDDVTGNIGVFYTREVAPGDQGPFLKEETKLVKTIAERLGHFLQYQQMRETMRDWKTTTQDLPESRKEWKVILELLRRTDLNLYRRMARKMIIHLCWRGVPEAEAIQKRLGATGAPETDGMSSGHENRPSRKKEIEDAARLSEEVFNVAAAHLSDAEILACVQKWIHEDKSNFLVRAVNNMDTSVSEVADALTRFQHLAGEGLELTSSTHQGVKVSLIRRFFTDELEFINVAKDYVDIGDFHDLLDRTIFHIGSHGKLGGKSAGLFLASRIICKIAEQNGMLCNIKTPKTWHITSDGILNFVTHNNLEEIIEQKYKDIAEIRREYDHIVQLFKTSTFSPEVVQGLSMALDDFEDRPVIVRSSSLLEDRVGAAFSGKYKSLFLANQGSKAERLEALKDAVAEVYSSLFGPDPIEYRAERGLLDFHEEMGIMIQEVVGTRVGPYFLPAYAGVAFSNNEFRWSPRIRREDGLIRLVPGLGTRAVDRLSDDFPVLLAPGQPGLRVNITPDEVMRYSPNRMDVINLETNSFETIEAAEFMERFGSEMGGFQNMISILRDGHLYRPSSMMSDMSRQNIVMTFEGLITKTPFVQQVHTILRLLQEKLHTPVDIEFASDAKDFYLLQCRSQTHAQDTAPAPIPKDIPTKDIVFSAKRYVSNGRIPDVTHIVYVDPQRYADISDLTTLRDIGRAVGLLNKLLPKHQFILMGPGRWGSRGDVKLGVSVTYSDINNTSMLIEIARKRGNYLPDLSFGTHFFQDLVEACIRYLPLYPDDPGIIFNEHFLTKAANILPKALPEFAYLKDTLRVIDVPRSAQGRVLKVLMNADLDEAIGVLAEPTVSAGARAEAKRVSPAAQVDDHWRWRFQMAERIAASLDPGEYGVQGFYVFGSTKNATAGPSSDIDVLVHFRGTEDQKARMEEWFKGWSLALDEVNYLRTGYRSGGLLDVHVVTDHDIAARATFAAKIGAITDAARPLPMKKKSTNDN